MTSFFSLKFRRARRGRQTSF